MFQKLKIYVKIIAVFNPIIVNSASIKIKLLNKTYVFSKWSGPSWNDYISQQDGFELVLTLS